MTMQKKACLLVSTGFFLWVMGGLYAISWKKVVTGTEEMIGSVAEVMADFEGEGRVCGSMVNPGGL